MPFWPGLRSGKGSPSGPPAAPLPPLPPLPAPGPLMRRSLAPATVFAPGDMDHCTAKV